METRHPAAPPARRFRIAGACVLAFAAVLAAAAYWRLPLAEAALHRLAARHDLGDISLAVTRLDFDGATIENLSAGPGVRVRQIDLRWAFETLLSRPVSQLRISGARIDLTRPGFPGMRAGDEAGASNAFGDVAARLPAIAVEDAAVRLPLPGGGAPADAVVSGRVEPGPSGTVATHGRLRLAAGRVQAGPVMAESVLVEGPFAAQFASGVVSIAFPSEVKAEAARIAAGPAMFAPVAIMLSGAASPALRIPLAETPLSALDAALRLETQPITPGLSARTSPVAAPLALTAELHVANGTARLEGRLSGPRGTPRLSLALRHIFASGAGEIRVSLMPLRLGSGGVQPGAVLPGLARIDAKDGSVRGEAKFVWGSGDRPATAQIVLDSVSLADSVTGVAVEDLSGRVTLNRLAPPKTAPGQMLRAARIDAGVSLEDVALRFQLLAAATDVPVIAVESFESRYAGGTLAVRNGRIAASGEGAIRLEIAGVDLSQLLQSVGSDSAAGTGAIDGVIPLRIEGGRLAIAGARLAARAPGRLHLDSDAVRKALAGAGKEVALMLKALEDFCYDRLSLMIDKPPDGIARLRLETFGRNPAVANGRPFQINLNVEADIDRIARSLAEALRLPGSILGTIVRGRR